VCRGGEGIRMKKEGGRIRKEGIWKGKKEIRMEKEK